MSRSRISQLVSVAVFSFASSFACWFTSSRARAGALPPPPTIAAPSEAPTDAAPPAEVVVVAAPARSFEPPPSHRPGERLRHAPDTPRTVEIAVGYVGLGLGSILTFRGIEHYNDSTWPIVGAVALMATAPGIATAEVGDGTRAFLFGSAIAATAGLGIVWIARSSTWDELGYALVFEVVAPVALGIIELATTPHRDDLDGTAPRIQATGPQLRGVAPSLVADSRGAHGGTLTMVGSF